MDTLAHVRDRLRLAHAWGEPSRLFLVAAELHVGRLEDHVGAGLVGPDDALSEALAAEAAAHGVRNRASLEARHDRPSL